MLNKILDKAINRLYYELMLQLGKAIDIEIFNYILENDIYNTIVTDWAVDYEEDYTHLIVELSKRKLVLKCSLKVPEYIKLSKNIDTAVFEMSRDALLCVILNYHQYVKKTKEIVDEIMEEVITTINITELLKEIKEGEFI